ncbi:MAG: STAS domain-containing protein [Verrucomicrobiota bacterium]
MPAPAEQPADRLLVTIQGGIAFVRVFGRGSFKISTAVKEFAVAAIDRGCRRLVLDMADCVGMDSTFMGVLAGLANRLKQKSDGTIVLVNLSPRTRGLLSTLGLDLVIEPYMTGAMPEDLRPMLSQGRDLTALDTREMSQRATAETMLEAHENLVRLSPENLPKFKDVLTFLREDLKRAGPDGREG